MATKTIYLKLVNSKPDFQLQWSEDQTTWTKVTATSPSTVVDSGDELDWDADDSIQKIQIKFAKGDIIPNSNVRGNDSKTPKGTVIDGVAKNLTDTYTIKVQPAGGGGLKEYDPEIQTPGD
jgi:hypothetical protein